MREIVSPLSGIRSPFGGRVDPYKVAGFRPALVADMSKDYFRNVSRQTFDDLFTTSRLGNATMVDSDGLLKWGPHNLALNSATPATQSITVVSGADYTVECTGSGSITLSGAGTGSVTEGSPVEVTASTTSLTLTVVGSVDLMWCYRSDLGGMAPVPLDARVAGSTTYVPTTSTAKYLPRRHNHTYNGSAWVDAGTLIETEARTQLLHTTNALVTQSHTVTAVPHTLHFTGTGTVTLSGASTAGPLVGTGTGEENRVSLTFTPTAASLTLTVTGTVTDAQLEVGSTPSSYIPNLAGSGTVTRAADSPLTIAGADVPWPTPTEVTGTELVTNGTFDTDLTGWVDASGGLAFSSVVSGQANINNDTGDGLAGIARSFTTEVGKVYRLTADLISTLNGARIGIGNSANSVSIVDSGQIDTAGAQEFVFVATATTTFVNVYTFPNAVTTANQTSVWDNISVKEINPLAVCIQMEGDMTYADEGATVEAKPVNWLDSATSRIFFDFSTAGANTGQMQFRQNDGTLYSVGSDTDAYSPGINVPFNIASRHGSTFINGAVDGTVLTEDTTPVALPDLSSTDLQIAYDFMGNVKQVRIWAVDIGDTGLEASTS